MNDLETLKSKPMKELKAIAESMKLKYNPRGMSKETLAGLIFETSNSAGSTAAPDPKPSEVTSPTEPAPNETEQPSEPFHPAVEFEKLSQLTDIELDELLSKSYPDGLDVKNKARLLVLADPRYQEYLDGLEDDDDEQEADIPTPSPSEIRPLETATAGTGLLHSIRKLWQFAKQNGVSLTNRIDRDQVIEDLADEAIDPLPEKVEDYWVFPSRKVGTGNLEATSTTSDWTVYIDPTGSAELVRHLTPKNVRVPGQPYQDIRVQVQNLEAFATSLLLLVQESDVIFEEDAAATLQEIRDTQANIEAHKDDLPKVDHRLMDLRNLCQQFSLVGPHAPTDNELPIKLAQAFGIDPKLRGEPEPIFEGGEPRLTSEGKQVTVEPVIGDKTWEELADEVLEAAKGLAA